MASPQAVLPQTKGEGGSSSVTSSQSVSSAAAASPRMIERELRFSLGQVVIMWSVIIGSMVAVFLFGLFTGREQGMKLALESQEQFAQRLPIDRGDVALEGHSPGRAHELAIPLASLPSLPPPSPATVGQALSDVVAARDVGEKPLAQTAEANPQPAVTPNTTTGATIGASAPAAATMPVPPPATSGKTTTPDEASPAASPAVSGEKTTLGSLAAVASMKSDTLASEQAKNIQAPPPEPAKIVKESAVVKESTKTQAVKPEPAKGGLSKGWYVQVAAAKSQGEVEGYVGKLKKLGMKVQLETATVRNVKYFRVMAGPFKNQAAAVTAQKKIKDAKVSLSTPFTKQVS